MAPGRRSRSVEHCNEDSEEATMATSDTGAGALQKGGEREERIVTHSPHQGR